MTIPARTLARLARLNLTDEQADAVAAMLRDVEDATKAEAGAVLEARRAADRKRKQEERERAQIAAGHVTSSDVTCLPRMSEDIPDTAESVTPSVFPSEEVSPSSPPKGGSVSPKRRSKKPVGTLCPEDLRPNEAHYLKCEQRGVPRAVADTAARVTVDWSHSNAHRDVAYKTDWPRAMHRILDDEIEKFRRAPSQGRAPPGQRISGPTLHAIAKHQARTPAASHDRSLDLDPEHRSHRDGNPARPAGSGPGAAGGDDSRTDGGESRTVFDFEPRRAVAR